MTKRVMFLQGNNKMRFLASAVLCCSLMLAACVETSRASVFASACQTAAGAVHVAATAKRQGKLSSAAVSQINMAVNRIDALCGSSVPPSNYDVSVQAVNYAVDQIRGAIR